MKRRKTFSDKCFDLAAYVILGIFAVWSLFHIYCMLITGFMPNSQFTSGEASFFPEKLSLQGFKNVLSKEYFRYLLNTLIVCLSNVLGVIFGASFTAFGLSKVKMKGKGIIFAIILGSVLLPGTVTSIPLMLIYMKINWIDTLLPLCLPIWFGGGAMNIFLIRQFIKGIPNAYTEAAIIDGASNIRIYWSIILPLIKPILIYLAIMTFIACWNDFNGPLLYVSNNRNAWTLSLALYEKFMDDTEPIYANTQMAIGLVMMVPSVFIFARYQKELTEGIAAVGVKG